MNHNNHDLYVDPYLSCRLCPRGCHVNRHEIKSGGPAGFCRCGDTVKAARAALHHWEEPCISGIRGSGTIFFTGCTLKCCFCQNYDISQEGFGKEINEEQLSSVFLKLQEEGAHNINLVTATQYLPSILRALDSVKYKLHIPVVYNCGGYERVETVKLLKDYVDIWLPDLKYCDPELSKRYSGASDYFETAKAAVMQMIRQTGPMQFTEFSAHASSPPHSCRLMTKGVIIRHMVLPGAKEDSIRILHWIKEHLPEGGYLLSMMSQYTPFYKSGDYPEINRRITSYEYYKVVDAAIELGLIHGFMQEKSSAKEEYTPPFNLEGLSFPDGPAV